MMYTWKEVLEKVNTALEAMPYDRKPEELYDPIRYVLSLGGKRVRPVLMMMSYNLYREDVTEISSQALAIEIYHNYTLLHDDLMDNADRRRGKETVHKKWDANTAILSGDSMLVMAYQYMLSSCPEEFLKPVMALFTETALEIGEGQQMDMNFEQRMDVKEEEYLEMIRLKTSVLLACAMKVGAILGGASAEDARRLYGFGEKLGLAFQLQDDYLDVYGDPEVFGKNIGGDILCNKKTYMLINALRLAQGEDKETLTQWIARQEGTYRPDEKVAAVTGIYDKIGIRALCDARIQAYFEEAKKLLEQVDVPQVRKQELWQLALSLMNRVS